jgi:hypothetical protein
LYKKKIYFQPENTTFGVLTGTLTLSMLKFQDAELRDRVSSIYIDIKWAIEIFKQCLHGSSIKKDRSRRNVAEAYF